MKSPESLTATRIDCLIGTALPGCYSGMQGIDGIATARLAQPLNGNDEVKKGV
jgi:hypothetical protein